MSTLEGLEGAKKWDKYFNYNPNNKKIRHGLFRDEAGSNSSLLHWKSGRWTSSTSPLRVGFLPFFWGVTPSVTELNSGIDDHGGLFALKAQPCRMLQAWSLAVLSWFTEYLVWILKSLCQLSRFHILLNNSIPCLVHSKYVHVNCCYCCLKDEFSEFMLL